MDVLFGLIVLWLWLGMPGLNRKPKMKIRLHSNRLESGEALLEVQSKGSIPKGISSIQAGFMISAMSKDDKGESLPALSLIEEFQEASTTAFQDKTVIGIVSSGQEFTEWTRIGVVPLGIILPAFSGINKLMITTRLVDMNNIPEIILGFGEDGLWVDVQEYTHTFENKGYREAEENKDKARALSIEIGMAVAMADGELDDTESEALKIWIQKIIYPFGEEKQVELKKVYNDAMKTSCQMAESGDLVLSDICEKLHEIGEEAQKYEALELAHEIMAADGVVHKEEMRIIHQVAQALGIDVDELANIRDQQIVALDINATSENLDLESLLGIEPSWAHEKILSHLREEFNKWNNRLNTLPEGVERDNAQQMLGLISDARKKYV
jgi:tellurite resistance protein